MSCEEPDPNELFALIKRTNDFLGQIQPEIFHVHRKACDAYESRFSELANIVPIPKDYARVVLALGNEFN